MQKLIALILIEQITKAIFASRDFFVGPLHFHLVKNSGLPFGINAPNQIVMAVLIVLIAGLLYNRKSIFPDNVSFMLLIAGAVSNLVDRVFLGYVRDFIDIGVITINLADLFILAGLIAVLFRDHRHIQRV